MKSWLMIGLVVFLTGFARGQVVADYPIEKLVEESEMIVEGEIIGKASFFGDDGLIYTRYDIDVSASYMGDADQHVSYVEVGGIVGDEALEVCPSLHLQKGSIGVIGLREVVRDGKTLVPVSSVSSWINYDVDSRTFTDFGGRVYHARVFEEMMKDLTGTDNVRFRDLEAPSVPDLAPSITSLSPTATEAGRGKEITINGSGFGSSRGSGAVEFRDVNYPAGRYLDGYEYTEWTDTRIKAVVPSNAGNGAIRVRTNSGSRSTSSQSLTVNYNVSNVSLTEHPYHIDFPNYNNGGYAFAYSTNTGNGGVDFTSIPAAVSAVERATSTWNSGTGFAIFTEEACGTTSIQQPLRDRVNLITFDNDLYDLDSRGSSVLGVTYSWYSICPGWTEWEVVEIDMVLRRDGNPNGRGGSVNWEYGHGTPSRGEVDFESVVLHELGHGHQLGHTRVSGAVMYPSISSGTTNRNLATVDDDGGDYCQSKSVGYSPQVIRCGWPFDRSRQYQAYNSSNKCSSFLPLELVSFDVSQGSDRSLLIEWETINEIAQDRIELQYRSKTRWPDAGIDTDDWTSLKTYDAPPAREEGRNTYYYEHTGLRPDVHYYRLKIVSQDGRVEYSEIRSGEILGEHVEVDHLIQTGGVQLLVSNPEHKPLEFGLYSLSGQCLQKFSPSGSSDQQMFFIKAEEAPSGIYLLKWSTTGGEEGETRKLFLH